MTLKKLSDLVTRPDLIEIEEESIVMTEFAVERYFQRLFFIGLRRKGVNYQQAEEIVKRKRTEVGNLLQDILKNYILSAEQYDDFKYVNSLQVLGSLFMNYTLPQRNSIAHGKYSCPDEETIILCIKINIGYILEIEEFLKTRLSLSAFDTPKKWGAAVVRRKLTDGEIEKSYGVKNSGGMNKHKAMHKFRSICFINEHNFLNAVGMNIIK